MRATSSVTVRAAEVESRGPVSASKSDRDRGEVSSDPPTVGAMGVVPTCTGLEDIEGLKGTESKLGITGEND